MGQGMGEVWKVVIPVTSRLVLRSPYFVRLTAGQSVPRRADTNREAGMSLSIKKQREEEMRASTPPSAAAPQRQERLRFAEFNFIRTPAGHCSADVSLEWEGQVHVGRAEGQSSPLGDFRVAAEATLRALEDFAHGALHFDLIGVKHVRAFDSNLLIVSLSLHATRDVQRLVGCYLAEDDARRGVAMAVLNATNRVLGNYMATR